MATFNVTLPNGKILKGIPEGTPKDVIYQKAINAGHAKAEDFPDYNPVAEVVEEQVVETQQALPQANPYAHPSDRAMTPEQTQGVGENVASLATGAGQSVADLGNMVSGVTNWTSEQLGKISPTLQATAGAMLPILNAPKQNIQVPRVVPKGQSEIADALRTAGEWGTPIPGTQFSKVTDPLMAGGAALGEYLTDGSKLGEIGGGITGFLASLIRGKGKGGDGLEQAQELIKAKAHDADSAMKNYVEALDRGEKGTLAELTKDGGIFNLEASAIKGSPLQATLDKLSQGRVEQVGESVSKNLGGEVPYRAMEDVSDVAAIRTNKLEKAIAQQQARNTGRDIENINAQLPVAEKELDVATQKSNELNFDVNPNIEPSEASKVLSDAYTDAEKTFRTEVEKPAWDKFSGGQKLDVTEVLEAPMAALDAMNPSALKIVKDTFKNEIDLIKSWSDKARGGMVEPDEVHTVISQIKSLREAAKTSDKGRYGFKLLGDLQQGLETSLKELGNKKFYDNAVSATKLKHERFNPSRVGKARKAFEPQTFAQRLLDTKEGGAVVGDLIKAADSPEVTRAAEQYIKSVVARDGIDDAFMANYSELLNRFPELKAQLSGAKKAQDELATATEKVSKLPQAMERETKAATAKGEKKATGLTKSVGNTQIAKLKDNPEKFIDASLVNKSVDDLTKLNKQISRVEGGQEALKLAIKERVLGKITKTDTGKMEVPSGSVGKFDAMKANLVDSGILTKTEADDISKQLLGANTTKEMRKASAKEMEKKVTSAFKDLTSSGLSVLAINSMSGGNPLLVAGLIRRNINRLMDNVAPDDVLKSIEDILSDPARFAEEAAKLGVNTDEKMYQHLNKMIKATSQATADDKDE